MDRQERYDAIVVGAGLAGLSCAHELCRKGKRVLVLEACPYAGGRTASFDDGGMAVESGLHRYIGYYSALPRLLRRCGTLIGDIVTWEEKVDILLRGRGKKLVLGLAPVFAPIKTLRGVRGNRDVLSARDKLSLLPFFLCGFAGCLRPLWLDGFSVSEFAERHHVTKTAQQLVLEPLSTGVFFLPPEEYSAYPFFGLFWPAVTRFYKMRIGAFLGGMSDVMCEPIVRSIKAMGGSLRFDTRVERVLIENRAVTGVVAADGRQYRAEDTVIAAHLPEAKRILSAFRATPCLASLFRLPCMSACGVQLELSRPALERDITTFGPGTDMISFAEQSRSTFRGHPGRLSVILGRPEHYADKPLEEILPEVERQMESLGVHLGGIITDARKVCERGRFYRLSKGCQRLRPSQRTGIKGLFLAGDYTLTSSFATMEGAVLSGQRAARACLKKKRSK